MCLVVWCAWWSDVPSGLMVWCAWWSGVPGGLMCLVV